MIKVLLAIGCSQLGCILGSAIGVSWATGESTGMKFGVLIGGFVGYKVIGPLVAKDDRRRDLK